MNTQHTKTSQRTFTHTSQFDFSPELCGHGAIAAAAWKIADGQTVCIDLFNRDDKNDSRALTFKKSQYFGIAYFDGKPALRTNTRPPLDHDGSHSLICSGNATATDPVHIAARVMQFIMRENCSDWFINNEG